MTGSGWRALLAATCVFALAVHGAAQEVSLADQDDAGRQTCVVRMLVCSGSQEVGGLGFARVEIDGVDDRAHNVAVEIFTPTWSQVDISAARHLQLGVGERARFFVPVPTSSQNLYFRVVVDRREHIDALRSPHAAGTAALFVAERADAVPDAMTILGQVPSPDHSAPQLTQCQPIDLPTDWRLFTAFHVVIVDGRAAVAGDVQEALRRFVFAGGSLLVATPERLPPGALRELLPPGTGDEVVLHGLGACVALPRLDCARDLLRQRVGLLPYLGDAPWPANLASDVPLVVPGLGKPPVLVFLSIIIAFALIAGPLNLIWVRRRRQPLLVLVTLPALGFGTTLAILAYGYLHDGVGVRGAEISWSLLDQARHEVTAVATRTLFAGIAPGDLQLGPDTFVVSVRACQGSGRIVDRWQWDLDAGRLDGSVLPSRTPTPLLTRQQGVARERLRVRSKDAGLELLVDGGVLPVGAMVLRDLDGGYWVGEAPRLHAATPSEVAAGLARLRSQATSVPLDRSPDDGRPMPNVNQSAGEIVQRMFPGETLTPGSYALMLGKAPWLDQHGLRVRYDSERHFVLGRMQAEDFVR